MTLYRPIYRDGTPALPFDSMTGATLFILSQTNPADWRIETISA